MAKILVVDDDPDFVEIVRIILRSKGHEVESATCGDAALAVMQASQPEIVLLDVMMDGVLDGVHTAQAMHDDPQLRDIPILMISSITESPMAAMFPTDEYLPIRFWITKPVAPGDLIQKIDTLVGELTKHNASQ